MMGFFRIFLEMLVCVLAAYGTYALLCRLVSRGCYRGDLSVAVHKTEAELTDAVFRAVILTEAQNGRMQSPVLLLEEEPSIENKGTLQQCGCRVYSRIL